MATKEPSDLANLSILYKTGRLTPAPAGTKPPTTKSSSNSPIQPSKSFNDRITLHRGDITVLAVDAIVNAANNSLLGGGGVDGAIHRAAGRELFRECRTLGGCKTGSAKITDAYELPCKKVIHAVGPVYDVMEPSISEDELTGCYRTSLELAVQNGCKSVAFSAISTGIYGYPSRDAATVAITTVKKFLEGKDGDKVELVIFVVFEKKDLDAFNHLLPQYLPPVPEDGGKKVETTATTEDTESEAKKEAEDEAEAENIAKELPDVPKSDPDAGGHVEKKQKHDP